MKKCPFCAELIQSDAIKCRFCGEFLNKKKLTDQVANLKKNATNIVISDIKKAKYPDTNKSPMGISGVNLLGAGKSITGWFFVLCGWMLGVSIFFLIAFCLIGDEVFKSHSILARCLGLWSGLIGGLFGQWLHQKIKNKF